VADNTNEAFSKSPQYGGVAGFFFRSGRGLAK